MANEPEAQLTAEQRDMSPEFLKKDTLARAAEDILKKLDPDVEIGWVSADQAEPGLRKYIQLKG